MTISGEIEARPVQASVLDESGDDSHWVRLARQGDQEAWVRLVSQHQQVIFRLAYLLLNAGSDADAAAEAEDVAQEAFVRAYLSLDKFDESRPLRPWLMQITRNLAHNRRRSLGRYLSAIGRWRQSEAVAAPRADPDDARLLRRAVSELPGPSQDVIYLRFFLDMSVAETAEALGLPAGTVKSRLHRALKQLRGQLTAQEID